MANMSQDYMQLGYFEVDENPDGWFTKPKGTIAYDKTSGNVYRCYNPSTQRWVQLNNDEYDENGEILNKPVKPYMKRTTTDANGNFSITFPSNFFTSKPFVLIQATRSVTNIYDAVNAHKGVVSSSGVSGYCSTGRNVTLLGLTLLSTTARAPTGIEVEIFAWGN